MGSFKVEIICSDRHELPSIATIEYAPAASELIVEVELNSELRT